VLDSLISGRAPSLRTSNLILYHSWKGFFEFALLQSWQMVVKGSLIFLFTWKGNPALDYQCIQPANRYVL